MIKKVLYKTPVGDIYFDNKTLFCEQMDLTGTAGVFRSDSLALSDGQVTTGVNLQARTIPMSFAFKDRHNDAYMRERLAALFSPLNSGELVVRTDYNTYTITVRPKDIPVFTRDKNVSYVWRWNVDFIADFPYWRKGLQQHQATWDRSMYLTVHNSSLCNVPMEIKFFGGTVTVFGNRTTGSGFFEARPGDNEYIIVNSLNFTVKNQNGEDCNQCIEATTQLDQVYLQPGDNVLELPSSGEVRPVVYWWDLSLGVI